MKATSIRVHDLVQIISPPGGAPKSVIITREAGKTMFGSGLSNTLTSLEAFNLKELESIMKMSPEPRLEYFLEPPPAYSSSFSPGAFAALSTVLREMVGIKAEASRGAAYIIHPNTAERVNILEALGHLQSFDAVSCISDDGSHSSWRFTELGSSKLVHCQRMPLYGEKVLRVRGLPWRELDEYDRCSISFFKPRFTKTVLNTQKISKSIFGNVLLIIFSTK